MIGHTCNDDLKRRHKLLKSGDNLPIFRRFLFFGICRSPPDFLDLEPGRKGQAADVCRPPPGDCSMAARFTLPMTEISADARRPSAGCPAVTAGGPAGRRRMSRNPAIIGRSPFGHHAAIEGLDIDVIWTWTFNICMIIVIVHNFYC